MLLWGIVAMAIGIVWLGFTYAAAGKSRATCRVPEPGVIGSAYFRVSQALIPLIAGAVAIYVALA